MVQTRAVIRKVRHLGCRHFWMEMDNPFCTRVRPGQFVEIRVASHLFLRRPFTLSRITRKRICILFRVRGEGTEVLSRRRPGEVLDILGPLGNGFLAFRKQWSRVWMVAGGTGIAPLVGLCEREGTGREVLVFYGARDSGCLFPNLLSRCSCRLATATDDGSRGHRGPVTDVLVRRLEREPAPNAVFAAGPVPMMEKVASVCLQRGIRTYVALENRMACGMGICLGCVVSIRDTRGTRLARVCRDGPVFRADHVLWEKL